MLVIRRENRNPYFNIAAEEYFLKQGQEDCFMLWQNDPAVIIGKHQNAFSEISFSYINKHKIPVIRRISGGGTVYHDPGNINFTFISGGERTKLVDFRKYTRPIINAFGNLGVELKFERKNNLTFRGMKVSGNAEHIYKNRVLHHGTLLFQADLIALEQAIKPVNAKFEDKSVKSVRASVCNLSEALDSKYTPRQMIDYLYDYIESTEDDVTHYIPDEWDNAAIDKLVFEKYQTWEWNFAYSPDHTFIKHTQLNGSDVEILMFVQKGRIKEFVLNTEDTEIINIFESVQDFFKDHILEKSILYENAKKSEAEGKYILLKLIDEIFT